MNSTATVLIRLAAAVLAAAGVWMQARSWFQNHWDGFNIAAGSHWAVAVQGTLNWWNGTGGDVLPFNFVVNVMLWTIGLILVMAVAAIVAQHLAILAMRAGGILGKALATVSRITRSIVHFMPRIRIYAPTAPALAASSATKGGGDIGFDIPSTPHSAAPAPQQVPAAPESAQAIHDTPFSALTTSAPKADSLQDFLASAATELENPTADSGHSNLDLDFSTGMPPALDAATIRAELSLWLRNRGWKIFLDQPVTADAGVVRFEGDGFDNDPQAFIPVVALSDAECALIFIEDLQGQTWSGQALSEAPKQPGQWRSEDCGSIPCPISLAVRARVRFLHQYAAVLATQNHALLPGMAAVPIYFMFFNGSISNPEDMTDYWTNATISATFVDLPLGKESRQQPAPCSVSPVIFADLFGANMETEPNQVLAEALTDGARAAREVAAQQAA